MRFLGYTMGDESQEMPAPKPELYEQMGAFVEEATKAGVLLATGGLAPTSMATKVTLKDGKFTVVDGPLPRPRSSSAAGRSWRLETRTRPSSGPSGSYRSSARANPGSGR
jgi:hypothetical protein